MQKEMSAEPSTEETKEDGASAEMDEQTAKAIEEAERAELNAYIVDLTTKIDAKAKCRVENLNCVRPGDEFFTKLDSNLKKNTAFVKKLKLFTASQLDALLKDMTALNLTKYISEISSALSEAKIKLTDVSAAITFCSHLHQIYADFAGTFFENWQKILSMKPNEKIQNASKLRVDLKFFAELVSAGIFSNKMGLTLLGSALMCLIAQDKDDYNNLSIVLSFCRHCGEEYAGLVPRSIQQLAVKYDMKLPSSTLLTPDRQQNLRNLLKDYYNGLAKHLKSEHKEYQSAMRLNKKIMESKGELSNERKEKLEILQNSYEKLLASTQTLSDLLNEPMPDLPKDEQAQMGGVVLDVTDDSNETQLDPWGDDETRNFYVDLPDLRIFLPNYAPKLDTVPIEESQITEEVLDMDIETDQLELEVDETAALAEETSKSSTPEPIIPDDVPSTSGGNASGAATRQQFAHFLKNLVNCVNKELIDSAAIEFLLNLNTKNNRKKLSTAIFGVKRCEFQSIYESMV